MPVHVLLAVDWVKARLGSARLSARRCSSIFLYFCTFFFFFIGKITFFAFVSLVLNWIFMFCSGMGGCGILVVADVERGSL